MPEWHARFQLSNICKLSQQSLFLLSHEGCAYITHNKIEDLLLTVGGDHSIGSATISAVKKTYADLRVVWVDAHPDCTNSHIRNPNNYFS